MTRKLTIHVFERDTFELSMESCVLNSGGRISVSEGVKSEETELVYYEVDLVESELESFLTYFANYILVAWADDLVDGYSKLTADSLTGDFLVGEEAYESVLQSLFRFFEHQTCYKDDIFYRFGLKHLKSLVKKQASLIEENQVVREELVELFGLTFSIELPSDFKLLATECDNRLRFCSNNGLRFDVDLFEMSLVLGINYNPVQVVATIACFAIQAQLGFDALYCDVDSRWGKLVYDSLQLQPLDDVCVYALTRDEVVSDFGFSI